MDNHAKEASELKNLRRNFERFCYKHRYKGISNLMLYIAIGTAIVYLFMMIDPSNLLYYFLRFDRSAILSGQVWRLFTYIFIPNDNNVFLLAISLYFYYFIGRSIEQSWGPFRFNLFYLSGVIITDLAALLLGVNVSTGSLNLSLLLAFATLYPENRVLLFFIIPIKMKWVAWFELGLYTVQIFRYTFAGKWGMAMMPVIAMLNLLVFFAPSIQRKANQVRAHHRPEAVQFRKAVKEQQKQKGYNHKCCVCGKTDTEYPNMQFRYCSKCEGYHCYCEEHIFNHVHRTE